MSGDYAAALLAQSGGAPGVPGSELPKFVGGGPNGEGCYGVIGDGSATNCGPEALDQTAARRHLDGANYLFADGHVKFQKPTQIYGNATPFSVSGNAPTFRIEGS